MKVWRTTAPAILPSLDARPEQITEEMANSKPEFPGSQIGAA
jgi:hypothetical protein